MLRKRMTVVVLGLLAMAFVAAAQAPSGAIFTTLSDGSEVNYNQFPNKEAVYLDGGPGPGAPQGAAGLPDGTYVFQVTNPNGKALLSTDFARCRQLNVSAGIISSVVDTDCEHLTGTDLDHGATTVQLMPYLDTPNNGGVYKVWVTPVADFLAGCAALGVTNGLNVVDCGYNAGNFHGFVPANCKTDNFKVAREPVVEIDTRFYWDYDRNGVRGGSEPWIDGLKITWLDTLGASNLKWSYLNKLLDVNHEAHVEGVEPGVHRILIPNQPGCVVGGVRQDGFLEGTGALTVDVRIPNLNKALTVFIDVACLP